MRKFTKLAGLCLAITFLISGLPILLHAQPVNEAKIITNPYGTTYLGDTIPFLEYRPAGHATAGSRKYPLIVFLHGIGERNNDNSLAANKPLWKLDDFGPSRMVKLGHPMAFTWNGKTDTFIVISPMCRQKRRGTGEEIWLWPHEYVRSIIEYAKNNLKVDQDRIYLTGMSFGGGGTFNFISYSEYPKWLAAAAPVCAAEGQFFKKDANGAKWVGEAKLPVWAFHAADDNVVGAGAEEGTIVPINAINNRIPAPEVKALMTIWPKGPTKPHEIWNWVYNIDAPHWPLGKDSILTIYEWFLGQNKSLPVNRLPTAHAGLDGTVQKNTTATLNGSSSTDPENNLVRYVWKKISYPSGASPVISNFRSANSSTTVTGLSSVGQYVFRLFVVDGRGGVSSDDVIINVTDGGANQLPVANAGSDKNITLPLDSVRLYGLGTDPDGDIASYFWEYIGGGTSIPTISPNPNAQNPYIKNLQQDTFYYRLTVTDNVGGVDYDTVKIIVNPPIGNIDPVANAGTDKTITLPVDSVRLYGSGTDADGTISSYLWEYIGVGPATPFIFPNDRAQNPIMKQLEEGTYIFRVKVTDNVGGVDYDTAQVTVLPSPNTPPIVSAGSDKMITLPLDSIRIYGTASDPGGAVASMEWEYIDGPSSYTIFPNESAQNPIFKNLTSGTYIFRYEVTDDDGAKAADTVQIIVNAPPIVNAGSDKNITIPTDSVRVYGSYSDVDGSVTAIKWEFISGPSTPNIYPNDIAQNPIMKNLIAGVYYFRLKATDNRGAIAYDTVKITVNSGSNVLLDEGSNEKLKLALNVTIMPNPANDIIQITLNCHESGRVVFGLYDTKGSLQKSVISEKTSTSLRTNVNISTLAKGLFYVQATINGKKQVVQFVRQ